MSLQHVGCGGIGDVVTGIGQCSLNAIASSSWILFGESHNGINDLESDARSASLAFAARIKLLRHEIPMPSHHRIGCDDGGQFKYGEWRVNQFIAGTSRRTHLADDSAETVGSGDHQ